MSADLKREIAGPTTGGWRVAWSHRPLASLTPGQVAQILRSASAGDARAYLDAAADIEEKDLHYRAVLQTRKLAVASLPLDIQEADGSRAAKRAAALVREALSAVDLRAVILHLLDALAKGYAVAEIVWRSSGGQWVPERIAPREPQWFCWDRVTGRELRLADGSADGQAIPPHKMIVHTPQIASGIPLMGGLARSALWAWVYKSYALRDWASFAEMYGQPIRLGKYDASATPEDVAVLKTAVLDIGTDAAAVLPASMAVEIVEASGKHASAELYQRLIEYLDRQVSKAVLGQTLTTDQGSTGSLAQARVHDEVRADLIRADARAIEQTLARDLVAPIVRLNVGDAPLPILALRVDEPEDLAALAEQVELLARAGMPIPQRWVRERWGIPEPAAGEPVLGATAPAQGAVAPTAQAVHALRATDLAHARAEDAPDMGAIVADRMATETQPAWEEIIARVQRIVDEASSLHELRDALLGAFGALQADALAEVMAVGFAAAELAGRYDVVHDSDADGGD